MPTTKGSKFDSSRDIAATAKLLRADIQEAIKRDELPAGKYAVTIERYSMGQSLHLAYSVKSPSFRLHNPLRLAFDIAHPHASATNHRNPEVHWLHTAEARALDDKLEAMIAEYNRETSSGEMDDSHNVHFYVHVKPEPLWSGERYRAESVGVRDRLESYLEILNGAIVVDGVTGAVIEGPISMGAAECLSPVLAPTVGAARMLEITGSGARVIPFPPPRPYRTALAEATVLTDEQYNDLLEELGTCRAPAAPAPESDQVAWLRTLGVES